MRTSLVKVVLVDDVRRGARITLMVIGLDLLFSGDVDLFILVIIKFFSDHVGLSLALLAVSTFRPVRNRYLRALPRAILLRGDILPHHLFIEGDLPSTTWRSSFANASIQSSIHLVDRLHFV